MESCRNSKFSFLDVLNYDKPQRNPVSYKSPELELKGGRIWKRSKKIKFFLSKIKRIERIVCITGLGRLDSPDRSVVPVSFRVRTYLAGHVLIHGRGHVWGGVLRLWHGGDTSLLKVTLLQIHGIDFYISAWINKIYRAVWAFQWSLWGMNGFYWGNKVIIGSKVWFKGPPI